MTSVMLAPLVEIRGLMECRKVPQAAQASTIVKLVCNPAAAESRPGRTKPAPW
jgi:hypothetical protein